MYKKLWPELIEEVEQNIWGIMARTETHWRNGGKGREIVVLGLTERF